MKLLPIIQNPAAGIINFIHLKKADVSVVQISAPCGCQHPIQNPDPNPQSDPCLPYIPKASYYKTLCINNQVYI